MPTRGQSRARKTPSKRHVPFSAPLHDDRGAVDIVRKRPIEIKTREIPNPSTHTMDSSPRALRIADWSLFPRLIVDIVEVCPGTCEIEYRNHSLCRNHFVGIGHDAIIVPQEPGGYLFLGDDNYKIQG